MNREEFIARVRFICGVSFLIGIGQDYNTKIKEDQLNSLLDGVRYLDTHLDSTDEDSHNNWMQNKLKQGWKFGEKKDSKLKTHPDLVPYLQLPEIEQRKDKSDRMAHKLASDLWEYMYPNLDRKSKL